MCRKCFSQKHLIFTCKYEMYDGVLSYYVYSKCHMTTSVSFNMMGFREVVRLSRKWKMAHGHIDNEGNKVCRQTKMLPWHSMSFDKQTSHKIYLWLSWMQALPNKDRDNESFKKLRPSWVDDGLLLKIPKLWRLDSMSCLADITISI